MSSAGPTSDGHNFLVRTSIRAFLDSMESSLNLESDRMFVDCIWCSNNFRKVYYCTKCINYWRVE